MCKPYMVPKLTKLVWYTLEEMRELMGDVVDKRKARRKGAPKLPLSPRERDVLWLAAWGHTHRSVALMLGISWQTAKNHAHNAYQKLGVHDKTAALYEAHRLGVIDLKGVMRWHLR